MVEIAEKNSLFSACCCRADVSVSFCCSHGVLCLLIHARLKVKEFCLNKEER